MIYRAMMDEALAARGPRRNEVPIDPLRDRYLELRAAGRIEPRVIAESLGWQREMRGHIRPDNGRVSRALGLRGAMNGRGERRVRRSVTFATAERLADLLGLDPREIGL